MTVWADTAVQRGPHLHHKWIAIAGLYLALGLVSVAIAYVGSRLGYTSTYVFFWNGLLLTFVPMTLVALRSHADRRERLLSVVVLGAALYLVKVVGWNDAFAFTDEFVHLRNTQDILRTGRLFEPNPLLPTAAYYPGLAALTAGLVQLSGLTPFASGVLVIGAARVVFCASFFLVAEKVTRSDRAAAAATIIYIANPMFLLWGASFAYENLALPLAALVVWWLGRTRRDADRVAQVVTSIAVVAVCVTHHVAGFALTALLGAWWLAERQVQQRETSAPSSSDLAARASIGYMAIVSGTASLMWLLIVAQPAATYLFTNNVLPALQQTVAVLLGEIPPRRLYASGGYAAPLWESVAGWAAVGLLLAALPPAVYRAWRFRRHAPMLVAVCVAVAYPLSLAPRLAPGGVAISGRLSEYVFAGLACVVALLILDGSWWRGRQGNRSEDHMASGWPKTAVATTLLTVVFIGNVTIGTAFYQRLPESSQPTGYPWSVQADVIDASRWARAHLGINHRFGSNAVDALALATYGGQSTVDQEQIWPIFFADDINAEVVQQIRSTGVQYLLLNWRMTEGVPPSPGYYFSPYEPHAGEYERSFPNGALEKFSGAACTRLIFKSPDIAIIDVSRIQSGSCLPASVGDYPDGTLPE